MAFGGGSTARRQTLAGASALLLALLVLPSAGMAQNWLPAERSESPSAPGAAAFEAVTPEPSTSPEPSPGEISESQTAFTDISDAAAIDLARQEFADILHADFIPELELDPGQEVDEYLGQFAARIISDGEDDAYLSADGPNPNLLVESTIPLRATEEGDLRPLDSDLEQVGDHFEADNPIVNSEISTQIDEGVELPSAELTVAPQGTDATEGEPVENLVFYPNADTDSDYLIAPTATGTEIFIQLRSAESPESFALDLDLPAGGTLEATDGGGAVVKQDGETVVAVEPPRALDAADQEVEVSYTVSGDQLTVEVPHHDQNPRFPIMVDPVFDDYEWGAATVTNPNPGPGGWLWTDDGFNDFSGFYHMDEGGLMNRATGTAQQPRDYLVNQWGEWYLPAIGNSSIERVDFKDVDHTPSYPGACTQIGIWNPGSWWAGPNFVTDPNSGNYWGVGDIYQFPCGNFSNATRTFNVGFSTEYDGPGGDAEAAPGSMAVFALRNTYQGTRSQPAENLVRNAHIYRLDRFAPSPPTVLTPTGWTKGSHWFQFSDGGLGAKALWIWGPNMATVASVAHSCTGAHQNPCPPTDSFEITNLPEGRHYYTAVGVDPVLNGAGTGFTAQVDKTPPVVTLSGSLIQEINAVDPLTADPFQLTVNATDEVTGGSGAGDERSGVATVQILVDGQTVSSASQSCPTHSCPLNPAHSWTLNAGDLAQGWHTLRVTVTDRAGNVATRDLSFWSTPQLGGSDVERFPGGSVIFANAQFKVIQGLQAPEGGCEFAGEDAVTPTDSTYGTEQRAFEAATCRTIARVGPLASSDPALQTEPTLSRPRGSGAGYDDDYKEEHNDGSSGDHACCGRLVAIGITRWEDPPNINVAETNTRIRWTPGTLCAGAPDSSIKWDRHMEWYVPSDWSRDYFTWDTGANCERIENRLEVAYINWLFCVPTTSTTVTVRPSRLRALPNGRAKMNWNAESFGDCASLLDFSHRLMVKPVN
jgi:hypothetical protein